MGILGFLRRLARARTGPEPGFYPAPSVARTSGPALSRPAVPGARRARRASLGAGVLLLAASCQSIGDINHFSPADDVQLGAEAYEQILAEERLITSGSDLQMVERLTDRLVAAARAEYPELVDSFEWEVRLIDNPGTVNAFCLPGGKMAVYTGILPVAQGETGLAVVMGHEIAHATERHGTAAMTRQMYTAGGVALVTILLSGDKDNAQYAAAAATAAATLATLHYGRDAEYEADAVGLRIMARAGYDPREAVEFWTRMNALGSSGTPEFLSTHPSNENRIGQIQSLLPQALELYQGTGGQ